MLGIPTGSDTAQYVHGPTGIQAMQDAAGDWRWTVQDALGSVRGEVDASLDMRASRGYAPYGEVLSEQGIFATPFGFTGEPIDTNGLVLLRARYYDPEMGRFLNRDPIEVEQNPYAYGRNNPLNYLDPQGEQPEASAVVISRVDCDGKLKQRSDGTSQCTSATRFEEHPAFLGVLIDYNGNPSVLTHGHWDALPQFPESRIPDNVIVRLRGQYNYIDVKANDFFYAWVQYRDAGTTISYIKPNSTSLLKVGIPAQLATDTDVDLLLNTNQEVETVYRAPNPDNCRAWSCLQTQRGRILGVIDSGEVYLGYGIPIVLTEDPGNLVVEGDSGAGIFVGNKLVANNWGSVDLRDINRTLDIRTIGHSSGQIGAIVPTATFRLKNPEIRYLERYMDC